MYHILECTILQVQYHIHLCGWWMIHDPRWHVSMIHHLYITRTPIFIIPCNQSIVSKMNKTQKYSVTQHHHTWLLKYFHEASKAWLILSQNFKFGWFESIGLVGNGFVWREEFLMELQTWVDFMKLWIDLICSWVGSTIQCGFT